MTAAPELVHDLETAQVEFRALGPLNAYSGGTRLGLGGKRQRLVLAVLLAHANRHLSQDALIDVVWDGVMPESGARSLHTYVSLLRKALGGGIERQGDGYVLEVQPEHFDVFRFESLVTEARSRSRTDPEAAAKLLRQGLGLWTGTPYGDLGLEPALSDEAARLAKERISALELRFEMDLQLGRHEQIVPEIEALLKEEPYREHLAGMLMIALFRSGRQAEALRAYGGIRERLVEELGIDPGQELQDLELRILERDPGLQASTVHLTSEEVHGARGYEVHESIGQTGFGERFRGFHGTMAREVSVLVIDSDVAAEHRFVRNFEAGMQAVSQIEHPNLAPVLDYWRDPESAYVITPFHRGGTLEGALADNSLTLATTLRIADQLCAGLGSLHRQGHAHGAITTSSVFLDDEHNAYLADIGLAEARGQGPIEVTDDVRQLGVLVEALLGGPDLGRPDIPTELAHAISRALHPEPELRYQRIEDFSRALRQSAGLDVMVVPVAAADVERRNPYKGLRAFQESDAADFHGRDALIQEMVDALTAARLMAVVGPSGSGKSSAVRAGLLPRLRKGAVPGSEEWLITDMFPGTHPFETLAAALLRIASTRPLGLYETLTADDRGLTTVVDQLLPSHGSELLLVVDQFEELFSLVSSKTDRQQFLDALLAVTEQSRLRIVLTLRADFFDQPLQYPEFAEIFRSNVVAVSPPTRDGLSRAISQPALAAGVSLEPGLVTQIVDDVREQPGGLPLLQFALTDLFSRREGDLLTVDAYNALGGVGGALANRAEETYASLSPQGKEAARQLFLRLVTVDELADDTRRRVRQSELLGLDIDRQVMSRVMQQFGALRFLSFDRDPASRAPTVELAHEALLREWQRLKTWIDERREDLLIHRRVQVTVQDWRDSGDDRSYLLRGGRLEQVLVWLERTDIAVSDEETALIEASIEVEREELAERQALEGKAARRRKGMIGVLAGGLVVAGVLGTIALDRARAEQITAARATARELSIAAMEVIAEDPELGVLLSLEAISATETLGLGPVPEAASALRTTLSRNRVEGRVPTGFGAVAYNGDGTHIVTDDHLEPALLHLWDVTTRRSLAEWTASAQPGFPPGEIYSVTYSPNDELLATSWLAAGQIPDFESGRGDLESIDGETMVAVSIHDANSLGIVRELVGEVGGYGYVSFGGNGLISAVELKSKVVYVWDLASGDVVDTFSSDTWIVGAEFLPGTTNLLMAHAELIEGEEFIQPTRFELIDVNTSQPVRAEFGLEVIPNLIALSPNGSRVTITDLVEGEVQVQIWDLDSETMLADWPHPNPQEVTWSPDNTRIAISGNDANITILDERNGWEPGLMLSGQGASVWSSAFSPDGETLASATADGGVVIWDVTDSGAVGDDAIELGSPTGLIFLGPNDRLIAGSFELGAQTIDLTTGEVEARLPINHGFHFSPNDRFTTVAGFRGEGPQLEGHLVNAGTGEVIHSFPECLGPRAVSFDDRYVVLDSIEAQCDDPGAPSHVFNLESEEMVVDLGNRYAFKAVFSPERFDGPPFVAVSLLDDLAIYSLPDGELVASYSRQDFDVSGFLVLSTDPEGKYLGIGTNGPDSIVIDMKAIMSGADKMEAVLFDVEGNRANAPQFRVTSAAIGASAGYDPVYRVWNIISGEFLFEVRVDGLDDNGAVNFTWDGSEMAYEDANGVIRFTPVDTGEVVERATETVTRSLTDDECTRYLHTDGCVN